MKRSIQDLIREDSDDKIVLISGPRQSGKTTLAKSLFKDYVYFNYDVSEDRDALKKKEWRRDAECVIFDELHKMQGWKRWIKGIYDKEGKRPRIIVTGSANMEAFRKVGDSLAGRYFHFHLHPFDLKEIVTMSEDEESKDCRLIIDNLLIRSGFPEPFIKKSEVFYKRWRQTHFDVILKQDFIDLTAIRSLKSLEILVDLLTNRIAAPISFSNLAQDLEVDPKTVKAWSLMLENFYVLFKVTPYHHNIARSILKEPKFYFFDIPRTKEIGPRLENLVACALLKEIHFIEDIHGLKGRLHYLRTRSGHEIDFLIVLEDKPIFCCEVKISDTAPSKHFGFFQNSLKLSFAYQLVLNCSREFDTQEGVRVRNLSLFLANFSLLEHVKLQEGSE